MQTVTFNVSIGFFNEIDVEVDVSDKDYSSCLRSHDAYGIGRSRVAASVIPDVNSICSSDKVAGLDTPAKITDNEN